jgi:hypothetical protein
MNLAEFMLATDPKSVPAINATTIHLENWLQTYKQMIEQHENLNRLTGADLDCALMRPFILMWQNYTKVLSELIEDKEEWLNWYDSECNMGESTTYIYSKEHKKIDINNLGDLAKIIYFFKEDEGVH